MAKCELDILLKGDQQRYRIGDKVSGQLKVLIDKSCQCDDIFIEKFWQTHGRGNKDKGGVEKLSLFQGQLEPGEYYYAFEFIVESEPLTYHGKIINIDWYLQARADIPWKLDPKTKRDILVEAHPTIKTKISPVEPTLDFSVGEASEAAINAFDAIKLKFIIPFIFLFTLIPAFMMPDKWREGDIFGLLFLSLFMFGPWVLAFKILKPMIAQKKLGKVSIELIDKTYSAGEELSLTVAFNPSQELMINGIKARLLLREIAVSGSGTNRSTHRHEYLIEEKILSTQEMFNPGSAYKQSVSFVLPENMMHSFYAGDNSLRWSVVVDIDVSNWPDWQQEEVIVVSC
ncbi:MAG: hypothetical protein HRU20_05785 [Pseudomonadales bacterium]|nr:hypothetical protein [Pseudomonadales bacterium]